jgi:hypothetical protein
MSELNAGDKFTWTHPESSEVYHFVAEAVEEFGNIYTVTLRDGTVIEVWQHEVNVPETLDIHDDQINPEPDNGPVRYGALR